MMVLHHNGWMRRESSHVNNVIEMDDEYRVGHVRIKILYIDTVIPYPLNQGLIILNDRLWLISGSFFKDFPELLKYYNISI